MNRIVGLSQCNMCRSHAFKTCVLSVVVFNYGRILSSYDIHVRDENASFSCINLLGSRNCQLVFTTMGDGELIFYKLTVYLS